MKKVTISHPFLNILLICIIIPFILSAEGSVDITLYKDGEGKIKLADIPAILDNSITFSGKSEYRYLWFQINKLDNQGKVIREREIKVNDQPGFDYIYYFKDGSGKYQIMILGDNSGNGYYNALCEFQVTATGENDPVLSRKEINKDIIIQVDALMGKTVGRGECWDLAQYILDSLMADWKRTTEFGLPLNPETDQILPGDLVQMQNLKLEYNNIIEYFGLPQHTAIVYKVLGQKNYILAHQNINGKRYVLTSKFNLNNVTQGTYQFYRPVAGFIKK